METFRCRRCGREVAIETTRCPECGTVLERVFTERAGASLEDFISGLVRDHRGFRETMTQIETELGHEDRAGALGHLRDFGRLLDSHIVDEEARILRVLIEAYGREGAADAIQTMQQHRRVHEFLTDLVASLSKPGPMALDNASALFRLLGDHMEAEETRVFPLALQAERKIRAGPRTPH